MISIGTVGVEFFEGIENYIESIVKEMANMPQKYNNDKNILEKQYGILCDKASKYLTKEFDKTNTDHMHQYLCAYLTAFYNFMLKYSKEASKGNNTELDYLFSSALRKYRDILYCLDNKDYESGLILFKSVYENIIVLEFLSFHPECIKAYCDYSVYNIMSGTIKKIEKNDMDIKEVEKNLYALRKKYGEDINIKYGWAKSVISKDEITSDDIREIICGNIPLIENINDMFHSLVYSDISGIARLHLTDDSYLGLLLNKALDVFLAQFMVKSFYDIFCDNNYMESYFFLKIAEISLSEWGYKMNIR